MERVYSYNPGACTGLHHQAPRAALYREYVSSLRHTLSDWDRVRSWKFFSTAARTPGTLLWIDATATYRDPPEKSGPNASRLSTNGHIYVCYMFNKITYLLTYGQNAYQYRAPRGLAIKMLALFCSSLHVFFSICCIFTTHRISRRRFQCT